MTRKHNGAVAAILAVTLLASLGAPVTATGQTAADASVWTAASLRGRVSADGAWRWTADSLVQSRDGVQTLDSGLGLVTITRDVSPRVGVGFGYGFGAGFPDSGALLEHRFTQQVTWSSGLRTRLSVRSVVEERFMAGRDSMLLRARQQVRLVWPLADRGRLRGIVSEEVLVQADSRALTSPRLNGNRVFVGIGRTLTPRSTMEVGYLDAYSIAGSNRRQHSHVLWASLAVSLTQGRQR
jgi:Protein of unknown function (DUF2490)